MVVLGVGTKPVPPSVQAVEIKLAHAKLGTLDSVLHHFLAKKTTTYLMPVVTATCPSRLNQPAKGGALDIPRITPKYDRSTMLLIATYQLSKMQRLRSSSATTLQPRNRDRLKLDGHLNWKI